MISTLNANANAKLRRSFQSMRAVYKGSPLCILFKLQLVLKLPSVDSSTDFSRSPLLNPFHSYDVGIPDLLCLSLASQCFMEHSQAGIMR
jgi:hypothetical protein